MKLLQTVFFIALCHIAYGNYAYFLASGSQSLATPFKYTMDTSGAADYDGVLSSCWNARYELPYQKVIVSSFDPVSSPQDSGQILTFLKTQPEGEAKAHRILVERSGDELVKYDFFIQNLRSDYWVKSMGIVLLEENHRFGSTFPIEHWNVDEVYVTDEIKNAYVLDYPEGANVPARLALFAYTGYKTMADFVKELSRTWQSRVKHNYNKIIVIAVAQLPIATSELATKLEEQSISKQAHIILAEGSVGNALAFGNFIEVLKTYEWMPNNPSGNTIDVVHLTTNANSRFTGNEWTTIEVPGLKTNTFTRPLPTDE